MKKSSIIIVTATLVIIAVLISIVTFKTVDYALVLIQHQQPSSSIYNTKPTESTTSSQNLEDADEMRGFQIVSSVKIAQSENYYSQSLTASLPSQWSQASETFSHNDNKHITYKMMYVKGSNSTENYGLECKVSRITIDKTGGIDKAIDIYKNAFEADIQFSVQSELLATCYQENQNKNTYTAIVGWEKPVDCTETEFMTFSITFSGDDFDKATFNKIIDSVEAYYYPQEKAVWFSDYEVSAVRLNVDKDNLEFKSFKTNTMNLDNFYALHKKEIKPISDKIISLKNEEILYDNEKIDELLQSENISICGYECDYSDGYTPIVIITFYYSSIIRVEDISTNQIKYYNTLKGKEIYQSLKKII